MKKYKKNKGNSAKRAAVFLTAAMMVQTTAPVMGAPLQQEPLSAAFVREASKKKNEAQPNAGNKDINVQPETIGGQEKTIFSNVSQKKLDNILPNSSFEATSKTNAS